MRIETQLAADNNIMHFFAESGFPVKGSVEFSDAKSLRRSPLAENIFDLGGVTSVVITPDCLSVTKEEGALWDDLVHNIVGLLNARIRPAIRKDGGDIVFRGFENGIVYVELQGKCVGCPYSQRTLKDGVEKLLRTYIKEVIAVEKYES